MAGPASPNLGNAPQGAAAEDPGLSRAGDASESGAGSMKSGGFAQLSERSEAGTVAGDSADDDDAVATSDLVVRQKDPVYRMSMPPAKLKAWRESKAMTGDNVGNIGVLFGNWGGMPRNALRTRASPDAHQETARANRVLGRGGEACRQDIESATRCSSSSKQFIRIRSCGCARRTSRIRVVGPSRR